MEVNWLCGRRGFAFLLLRSFAAGREPAEGTPDLYDLGKVAAGLICSREVVGRRRGVRRLPIVEGCAKDARGVSDDGMEGFCWDRAAAVGVGMLERGKGRRDEGFGMPLDARPVVVAPLGRFSSMLTGTRRGWI